MKVVQKAEYSLVIEYESDDARWLPYAVSYLGGICKVVDLEGCREITTDYIFYKDSLCSGDLVILYFDEKVPDSFKVGQKIYFVFPIDSTAVYNSSIYENITVDTCSRV